MEFGKERWYHDQIFAISQQAINKVLQELWEQRQEKPTISLGGNENGKGVLTATLEAPSILIPAQQNGMPDVYLQIQIETGMFSMGTRHDEQINLDGWLITINTNLAESIYVPDSPPPSDTRARLRAGEYSIHRLLAALSDHMCGTLFLDHSTCPSPEGRITLRQWQGEFRYKNTAEALFTTLDQLAGHHPSDFFTLGLRLQLPEPDAQPPETRGIYLPSRRMFVYTYPYLTEQDLPTNSTSTDGLKGHFGSPHNAIAFFESTHSHDAYDAQPWSGNLTNPETEGVFILNHQFIFHQFLFRIAKELPRALVIILGDLKPMIGDKCRIPFIVPKYSVGTLSSEIAGENLEVTNFETTKTGEYTCEAKWCNRKDDVPWSYTFDEGWSHLPKACVCSIESTMTLRISWEPKANCLQVQGTTLYNHSEEYGPDDSFTLGRDNHSRRQEWYRLEASWKAQLQLHLDPASADRTRSPLNGVLQLRLLRDVPTVLNIVKEEGSPIPRYFYRGMKDRLYQSVQEKLQTLQWKLENGFPLSTRFYLPGRDEVAFDGPPQLSAHGDIRFPIRYLQLDSGRILPRPRPVVPSPEPPTPEPEPEPRPPPTPPSPEEPSSQPLLAWQCNVIAYDAATRHGRITLRASNFSDTTVAFSRIKCICLLQGDETIFEDSRPKEWRMKPGTPETGGTSCHPTWGIRSYKIEQAMTVCPRTENGSLIFDIQPPGPETAPNVEDRILVSPGAYLCLELAGTMTDPGQADTPYIMKLQEAWESPMMDDHWFGKGASTFIAIFLHSDGGGDIIRVSGTEAQRLLGP